MNDRRFDLDNYVSVQERIHLFWKDYPNGRIVTSLESPAENFKECRYRACVYKNPERDTFTPDATGYAFEVAGAGMANKTSHEENCETSAIGRALANLGYATSQKDRPSREEMAKVNRPPTPLKAVESIAQERQRQAAAVGPSVPPPAAPAGPPHPLAEGIEQDAKGNTVWAFALDGARTIYFNAVYKDNRWVYASVDTCQRHGGTKWTATYDEGMGKSIPVFVHRTSNPEQPCVLGSEDDGL